MNKFSLLVALVQACAGIECLTKQQYKPAILWFLYATASLIMSTMK